MNDTRINADELASIKRDVRQLMANYLGIAVFWTAEDVRLIRPDLSDEEAFEVLSEVNDNYDPASGITSTTIKATADELFSIPSKIGSHSSKTWVVTVEVRHDRTVRSGSGDSRRGHGTLAKRRTP